MKKILGYLGMIIFILISAFNKMLNIKDSFTAIVMIVSVFMFLPMLIDEIKTLIKDHIR